MNREHLLLAHAPPSTATAEESGDERFRSDLVRNLASAYRLATVILGNGSDAEDVTQDALERAWTARSTLRDADRFEAWFQRILINACRDRVRRHRAGPALLSIGATPEPHGSMDLSQPTDPFAATIAQDAVRREFVRLNVDQRVVVAMRFYLDLQIDEIARRLGTREGTIKSRLHRALKVLRDSWASER